MPQPVDILDERDPLTVPFIGSIVLHGTIAALLFLYWFWTQQKPDSMGEQKSGGQAYAVSVAHTIPIPQHDAPPNPVAHDTDSLVPTAPAEKEVKKEPPPPMVPPKDAFEIPDRLKPQKTPQQQKTYTVPAPPNQVYSQSKQAVSNPMYAPPAGGGQIGIGPNSMLGNRYGAYAQLIRDRLLENWQTNGLHSQGSPAVVDFHVQNGKILDAKIVQSSGNPEIDNSALRAVYASDPLTPFPPGLAGNNILAEFTFNINQR
jgi:protein TonB